MRIANGAAARVPGATPRRAVSGQAARCEQAPVAHRLRPAAVPRSAAVASPARLLAETSHDLRQPIQAIGLWVELLQSQAGDAETRAILQRLHQTAQGLESVIDSLLDISRLDMGAVEPRRTEFSIDAVLDRLAATFGPAASSRGLAFRMRTCEAMVRSDPALVERILGNFVSNAVRHCDEGGVLVGCRRRGRDLCVEVWDTGPGVPADRLADIFREFVQLRSAARDRSRGFGLGLSIARRMADLLRHEISVISRVGRGSCFRLRLPLAQPAAQRPGIAAVGKAGREIAGSFVVFVDDERELRDAMALLLARWGCHAIVAGSADEAIEQLAGHLCAPDLVIGDYRLADGESGLDAIASIRAALGHAVDAILISGERGVLANGMLSASGIPVLRKPVDPDVIRTRIALSRAGRSALLRECGPC